MKKVLLITILLCTVAMTAESQTHISVEEMDSIRVEYYNDNRSFDFLILPSATSMQGMVYIDNRWEKTLDDTTATQLLQLVKAAYFDKSPIVKTIGEGYTDGDVVSIKAYSKGKQIYESFITSETEYEFTPEYETMLNWMKTLFDRFQFRNTRYPSEIIMLAEDLDLLTAVRVTPEMFDQWELDSVRLDGDFVFWSIIRDLDKETVKYKPCEGCGIDVRGKLILKYYNRAETIYYNKTTMYRDGEYYKIQTDFPQRLEQYKDRKINK
ncbi:MAG: hypothetical protein IJ634_01135 [Bacteroidales bacterium]|nr:hypothetical protein [Bacteroidales bacterium]